MINNFFGSVGQVADKIENNIYINRDERKRRFSIVDVDAEEIIEDAVIVTDEELCSGLSNPPMNEIPESVKVCFRFPSEFVRQQVEAIVNEFYLGSPSNLAMIEVALFDHGQLHKRNIHKAFVRALMDWKILPKDVDIEKTTSGMASKLRNPFPKDGYKKWNNFYLNERNLCANIGNRLPDTMKYNRNE